jgi:hypothetical protein
VKEKALRDGSKRCLIDMLTAAGEIEPLHSPPLLSLSMSFLFCLTLLPGRPSTRPLPVHQGNWSSYVGSRTTVRILNNYWTKRYKWTRPKDANEEYLMLFSFSVLGSLVSIEGLGLGLGFREENRGSSVAHCLLCLSGHDVTGQVEGAVLPQGVPGRRLHGSR